MTGAVRTILRARPGVGARGGDARGRRDAPGHVHDRLRSAARHEGSDPDEVRARLVATIRDTATRLDAA